MPETKAEKFARLYPKFVKGRKWLDERIAAGIDVREDTEDFTANVIYPLHNLFESLSTREKEEIKHLMKAFNAVRGTGIKVQQQELVMR